MALASFLDVPNHEFSQGFDQMGRGPQPFEPPGRGGVTLGRIAPLGVVDGTTVAFGVTVAVFFASNLMSASFDDETCAEASFQSRSTEPEPILNFVKSTFTTSCLDGT